MSDEETSTSINALFGGGSQDSAKKCSFFTDSKNGEGFRENNFPSLDTY
jgi:hypothetical protein